MSLLLITALAAFAAVGPPAGTVPRWTFTATQDVRFFRLTPLGTLVVSTGDELDGVDPESGAVLWRRADLRGVQAASLQTVPGSAAAVVNLSAAAGAAGPRIELLDLETGTTRWDSRGLGLGGAIGILSVPHRHLVVIYAAPAGDSTLVAQIARRGPWTFVAVDVATGRTAWVTDHLVRAPPVTTVRYSSDARPVRTLIGAERGLVLDTDSTAILDLTREGPIRLDLVTGERIWPTAAPESLETRGAPGVAPMAVDDSAVYAPRHGRLQALSLTDGRLLWERPGDVYDLRMTPRGLLVCSSLADAQWAAGAVGAAKTLATVSNPLLSLVPTGGLTRALRARRLDLLDPRTGEPRWTRSFDLPTRPKDSHAKGSFAPFDARGDTIYVGDDGILRGLRLADGHALELGRYGQQEEAWPEGLEARASGVVLRTPDALFSLDPTTGGRYGPYGVTRYRLPVGVGPPGVLLVGGGLLIGGAVVWFISTALADVHDAYTGKFGPYAGEVLYATSGAQQVIPAIGVAATIGGLEYLLSKRYRSARLAESSIHELTTVRDSTGRSGPGIVRIDKDTGKIEAAVLLRYREASGAAHGDRQPVFEVDDIAGRFFYRSSPRTIACFAYGGAR